MTKRKLEQLAERVDRIYEFARYLFILGAVIGTLFIFMFVLFEAFHVKLVYEESCSFGEYDNEKFVKYDYPLCTTSWILSTIEGANVNRQVFWGLMVSVIFSYVWITLLQWVYGSKLFG